MSKLLTTTEHYRSRLITLEDHTEHSLRLAHTHMLSTLQPALHALYRDLDAAYAHQQQDTSEDEPMAKVPLHWLYASNRMQHLTQQVESQVNQFAHTTHTTIAHLAHDAQSLGHEAAHAQLAAVSDTPPKPVHEAMLTGHLTSEVNGLVGLTSGYGAEASKGVKQTLIRGLALGHKTEQISKEVGQVLLKPLQRVIVTIKGVATTIYRKTVSLFYKSSGMVIGWVWTSQEGVCEWCQSQNGSKHGLDEEMKSHDFCHCVQTPLLANG